MRSTITTILTTLALAGAGLACDTDAEERAEERIDQRTEADGTENLEEELQEIGAGEVADFEQEQREGHPIAEEFREEVREDDDTRTERVLEEDAKE